MKKEKQKIDTKHATPANRDQKGRFLPGVSGNKQGSKHRITKFVEMITQEKSEEIITEIVDRALAGDSKLLSYFQKVYWPIKRGDYIKLQDLAGDDPTQAILVALAKGQITDTQAINISRVVEISRVAGEVREIKLRLEELENES